VRRIWFYARVSSKGQNLARQIEAAHELGIPDDQIVQEKMSGKNFSGREAYLKLKSVLQAGDVLYVMSVDRLGRNYDETYAEWQALVTMGVDIVVLDMPLLDTRKDRDLTGELIADIVLQLLSYVAEKEREFIRQRQAEGIAAAKARGVQFGRKPMPRPEEYEQVRILWEKNILSARQAAQQLGISHHTFLRWARGDM